MGFSVNIKDVESVEISPGVFKRALMKENMKGKGPPGNLVVNHYTLKEGGVLTIGEPGVEYQDYIISGSALFGRRYIHSNTTIFAPTGSKHSYAHSGESDLRIISHGYTVHSPSHRWCKTRL